MLSVSCGAALVTYCIWAFDTKEIAGTHVAVLRAVDRADGDRAAALPLILEQGHGAAPEEIFVADRTLQVLGLIWVVVFGLGVYVR